MKDVRPLRSEADYDAALEAIEAYFINEPEPGTPESDRFDLLAQRVLLLQSRKHLQNGIFCLALLHGFVSCIPQLPCIINR